MFFSSFRNSLLQSFRYPESEMKIFSCHAARLIFVCLPHQMTHARGGEVQRECENGLNSG